MNPRIKAQILTFLIGIFLAALWVASAANAQSIEGTQDGGGLLVRNYGSQFPTLPATPTPLLQRFYFGFDIGDASPSDHHIAAIRVFPGGNSTDLSQTAQAPHHEAPRGKIELMYQDKNPNDKFFYKVAHVSLLPTSGVLPRFQIRDVGCVGSCVRELPDRPAQAEFALVGFYLYLYGRA